MLAGNWTSDVADVEKHSFACALVGADFKAADADKADATARLFPSSLSPPPLAAAALPVSLPSEADTERKIKYLSLIMTLFINM